MGSEQNRFLLPQHAAAPRRKRWGSCLPKLSCFRKQKGGGKRIVPATRLPESNSNPNQPNGPHQPLPQPPGIPPSLYAPPSSPASFSHSAVPSTAPSPPCFLSANSPPPGPTMFVTGPYAHETQLVSPPVFSTFTTEPSTAPLTPPPELAHLTTPSSPDVPYAHFLSSSRSSDKTGYNINDLQATYSLYPGSPASALRSPASHTPRSHASLTPQWSGPSPEPASDSGRARQDSNFFCPETFAQFYLDQSSFSNGRLSISREADGGQVQVQNRQTKICKADAEELEAYRASFGFSADEIVTTAHYVEISDGLDEPFSMAPIVNSKSGVEEQRREDSFPSPQLGKVETQGQAPQKQPGDTSAKPIQSAHILSDDEDIFAKMESSRVGRKHHFGSSNSDAEIEYRRGRSLRQRSRRES